MYLRRSGKSFLISRLLGQKGAFKVRRYLAQLYLCRSAPSQLHFVGREFGERLYQRYLVLQSPVGMRGG